MTRLSPPDAQASARLIRLVAGVTLRRLRKVRRRLLAPPFRDRLPRGASLLRAAEDFVRTLDRAGRLRLLHGPDLRGFLSEIEIWSDIFLKAGAARRPAPRGCRRRAEVLFDRISRTEHLVELVPAGRLDPGFPDRAARLAAIRLRHAFDELPAILLGARLAFLGGRGTFEGRLATRESPEQGRPAGRADLGTFCGEAGPLALLAGRSVAGRGGRASGRADGAPLGARLKDGLLVATAGRSRAIFPRAASRWRFPWLLNGAARETSVAPDRASPRLVRRRLIPGTSILLGPALRSSPRRLRVGRQTPGLEDRLAAALRLVRLAWPEAHDEIERRTAMVIPVREPGLVSYSLAARPGVSFINVHGKTTLALADDLLHETAHHLLHDVQETARLLVRGPETEEVQGFNSSWRGGRRPLHGVLHAAFTFLFRAELLARLLGARARIPRVVGPLLGPGGAADLRRDLRLELGMIGRALEDLDRASRSGLMTAAGRALVRSLRDWRRRLVRTTGEALNGSRT